MREAKALTCLHRHTWACATRIWDKYQNLMSWSIYMFFSWRPCEIRISYGIHYNDASLGISRMEGSLRKGGRGKRISRLYQVATGLFHQMSRGST